MCTKTSWWRSSWWQRRDLHIQDDERRNLHSRPLDIASANRHLSWRISLKTVCYVTADSWCNCDRDIRQVVMWVLLIWNPGKCEENSSSHQGALWQSKQLIIALVCGPIFPRDKYAYLPPVNICLALAPLVIPRLFFFFSADSETSSVYSRSSSHSPVFQVACWCSPAKHLQPEWETLLHTELGAAERGESGETLTQSSEGPLRLCVSWWVLLCMPSLQLQACAAVFLLHCRGLRRLSLTTLDRFPRQPGCLHMESNQLPQMRAFVSTVTITGKERERREEKRGRRREMGEHEVTLAHISLIYLAEA